MSFSTASTQIRDLISKRETILQNVASAIAGAIIERQQKQGLSGQHKENTITDIKKLLAPFSAEEREIILTSALIAVASNGKFGAGSNRKESSYSDDFSDMFKRRR